MRYFPWLGLLLLGFTTALYAETQPSGETLSGEAFQTDAVPDPGPTQLDLETALQWTLSANPDLVALRQNLCVSSAALAVARQFPTSLNPTVEIDLRPWTFEPETGRALQTQFSVSWAQPIELGHRTGHRTAIAQAAYNQTQWSILEAELQALVETYRQHQTAVYRRAKLEIARAQADFNGRLIQTVRRQVNAGQVAPPELIMAEVESQSTIQKHQTAEQEYADALSGLRKQIGLPQFASAVPAGDLRVAEAVDAAEEDNLIRIALESHPEINAARAQAAGSHSALCLARADRIPIPSVGPVYERDETGTTFYGVTLSSPVPVLNTGKTLVWQREMEHSRDLVAVEQLRVRTIARVKASLVRWNKIKDLVGKVAASTQTASTQAERMDRAYAAGQTDLLKLIEVREHLNEVENARLDMVWQATQAYADLLAATGATPLLGSVATGVDTTR